MTNRSCTKPRVLIISRKWAPAIGGMETHAQEVADALRPEVDTTLLVLPGRANGKPPRSIAYIVFTMKAMAYCLVHGRRFTHVIMIDLLLFPALALARLVRRDQRRIVVVYGLDMVFGKRHGIGPSLYGIYYRMFCRCAALYSDIVAISSYTAKLAAASGLSRVRVIHPAIPDSPLTRDQPIAGAVPVKFAQAARRILQIGRIVPRKGALWFAQHVVPDLPADVTFFVAGPATGSEYAREVAACDRTVCLGVVPPATLAAMIQSADIVVMPNIAASPADFDVEGFGLVVIEASSLGGIVVASRFQGLTDAVVDGLTGTLVEPGVRTAWASVVGRLLNEAEPQRKARRVLAMRETKARYGLQAMRAEFLRLLCDAQ